MMNLRALRERAGLTQLELGEMVDMSRFAIIDYESGRRSPTFETTRKLARALDCSLSDLDGDLNPPQASGEHISIEEPVKATK
ncbi:MAG: helix-turn-helix transcriptional regulator [Aminivibrio sp.]|jgi:transcriptional regulator with XRE-family HTH domain